MIQIIQKPDNVSFTGNMNPLKVRTDADEVQLTLSYEGESDGESAQLVLLERAYSPNRDGMLEVDLREVSASVLSFLMSNADSAWQQPDISRLFTVSLSADGNETADFEYTAIRGGVDSLADTVANFLAQNFLTWQPSMKPVTYYTPEFLTYYAMEGARIRCRAFAPDGTAIGTDQGFIQAEIPAGQAWTVPVGYAVIAARLRASGEEDLPAFYDVWAESLEGERLTYVQRYYAQDMRSEQELWVLFENSLGGIDTFRAYGDSANKADHKHNVAEIADTSEEYRVDTTREYKKNTGRLDKKERMWLLDFFPSLRKYVYNGQSLRRIVVTEDDADYKLSELPSSYTFTFRYADATPYLNIPRQDVPPEVLDVAVPELGSFTVAPRLVEFPRTPLTGGALFPVQDPYAQGWGTTSFGAIFQRIRELLQSNYGGDGGVGHTHSNLNFLELLSWDGIRDAMAQWFLSRTADDTAQGFVRFMQGLKVGNMFTSGILGEGGVFRKDADGKVYIEADKLYIRMKSYFDNVEIRDYQHSRGNRIASVAGCKCVRVEGLDSNNEVTEVAANTVKYRCYFRGSDGDNTITNDFVVGDQAYCDVTNVVDGELRQHTYWRLIVGKSTTTNDNNEHYIDLSNTASNTIDGVVYSGYRNNSNAPLAQDDIIQLGNVNDSTRRGAIVEYVSGADAPSYQIFQDLGSIGTATALAQKQAAQYSLEGRNYVSLGYNSQTGKAYLNVYGDTYIGDKPDAQGNAASYIKYNSQTKELEIKAKLNVTSTIGNQSLEQYIQDHQTTYDDTALRTLIRDSYDELQSQIDGAIDTWFYNGVPSANTLPESEWKATDQASGDNNERLKHLGDVYYDNKTGYAYRYTNTGTAQAPVFTWTPITDSAVVEALAKVAAAQSTADSAQTAAGNAQTTANNAQTAAENAQDAADDAQTAADNAQTTANSKRTIYLVWGAWMNGTTNNLKAGDLFIPTTTTTQGGNTYTADKVYKCTTDGTAMFQEVAYTDDSKFNGYINAILNGTGASGDAATVAAAQKAIKEALGNGTLIDGGLVLTSLLAMRDSGNAVWAGINGQYQAAETGTGYKGHGIAAWYGGGMVDHEVNTTATDYAKSLFRFDGSGYLAGGNITWDKDGIVTIANVYSNVDGTNVAWSGQTLQYITNLATLLPTKLVSGVTYLDPKVSFYSLSIQGNEVATQAWVGRNYLSRTDAQSTYLSKADAQNTYVSTAFFNAIFQLQDANGNAITPNNATTAKDRLKILVGAYTDQYLSALGLSANSGGGSGVTALADLVDISLSTPSANQILKFNGTHWVNAAAPVTYVLPEATADALGGIRLGYSASGRNYAVQLDGSGRAYVTVPLEDAYIPSADNTYSLGANNRRWSDFRAMKGSISGDFYVSGKIYAYGNIMPQPTTVDGTTTYPQLGTSSQRWSNVLTSGVNSKGNIVPADTEQYQIGTSTLRWLSVVTKNISATGIATIGSLTVTGSTTLQNNTSVTGSVTATSFVKNGGTSAQFLKADGSVDSNTYLTDHQTLYTLSIYGGTTKVVDFKPNANASIYIKAGGDISLTNDTTNKYITLSYTHPTNGANTTIATADGRVLSAITVNSLGHVTSVSYKALAAADIPNLDWSKIASGKPTTLAGYGITDAKIASGVITLGSNTITPITSAALTMPTGFSVSGSPISKTGTFAVSYASGYEGFTTALKNKLNTLYDFIHDLFTKEGSGTTADPYKIKANYGLYTEKFLSALGLGDSGSSGGGMDTTAMWSALGASTSEQIALSHLTNALSGYAPKTAIINISRSGTQYTATRADGSTFTFSQQDNNTWTAWRGATSSAAGTAGYMPAPTAAQYQQFLRGDGTWVSLNNYSLPLAANGTRGGVQIGFTTNAANRNYAVQLSAEKMYVNVPWVDTVYSLPTASSSQKGGVKVGSTLAISSEVLNLASGIVTTGTYRSVTVDTYGRVTAGTNPTTLSGYGITDAKIANGVITLGEETITPLTAASSLAWSKLIGKPTTLAGYGITDAKIASGVITLGSNTITPITSASLTMPTGFSVSGSPISKTGTFAVSYASGYEGFTTALKNKLNTLYDFIHDLFTKEGSGTTADPYKIKANYGLYTEKFLSALGLGDSGSSGGGGLDPVMLWSILQDNYTTYSSQTIDYRYLSQLRNIAINVYSGTSTPATITYNGQETKSLSVAGSTAITGISRSGTTFTATRADGTTFTFTQQDNNTWTAWKGATSSAAGTAGYMPAPTAAQYQQFLRGDGTWVSLNNYSLPLAASGTRGGIQIGYTQSGKNYPVQLSSEKAYVNVPWTDTDTKVTAVGNHYTPTANADSQLSASATGATAAWSIDVVKAVQIQRDAAGHVTGVTVTSGKIPANPNTDTGATSVTVTGSGNAVTTASYDASTRKLTLTKGTTFLTSHQSKYATTFGDTRSTAFTPTTAAAVNGLAIDFKNAANGVGVGTYNGVVTLDPYSDVSGGYPIQLGFDTALDSSNAKSLFWRSAKDASTWNAWRTILDSQNSSVSLSGSTLTVKINGVEKSLTNTNTTYSAGTGLTLSSTTFSVSQANASTIINLLSEGSSDPTDADFYVAQYAGGGTTTTTYHRRPHSALYNYIKTKLGISNKGATLSWGTAVTVASIGGTNINVSLPANPNTDTKNTAGSTDSSSKLFIIGATSQAANPQTYSHDTAYIGTDGHLYSNSSQVVNLATAQTITSKKTFSVQQAFTVATGTSPFTVASTTVVSNLNADLLDGQHGSYYATASGLTTANTNITTLQGYFSSGVANSAAKLTTVSKTAWGQTYWTSGGVPTSISGTLSSVTNINMSGYIKIGDAYIAYDSTNNALKVYKLSGSNEVALNFYATGGVSALGQSSSGSGGGGIGDVTWDLLASSALSGRTIHGSYIASSLANYLPLAGGTMTGAAPITFTENKNAIEFRNHASYYSRVQYKTTGNEALVFANKNAATSYIFKCGLEMAAGSDWTGITPSLQIKGQSVYINFLIGNGVTPSYNFYVGGSMGISGQLTSTVTTGTAPFAVSSTTAVSNLNADLLDGVHASGLFTALSNSGNNISVTVGGTNKTLTVGYATSSTSASYASKVVGSYTLNGGQQNPNYFGTNRVGFLMMNTTVNGNSQYKDWLIMDCYSGGDVGGGVAIGVNRQALGAYIMRSESARTSWAASAELLGTHNYASYAAKKTEAIKSISRSGTTFTATRCDDTTFTFTQQDNNTWRGMQNNLTTSTSTTSDSLSAYQGYLLANGSARDNTKLPLSGGTITNTNVAPLVIYTSADSATSIGFDNNNSNGTRQTLGFIGFKNDGVLRYFTPSGRGYNILHADNSSVSKSGSTLTVKINGTSQSLTNTDTLVSQSETTTSNYRGVVLGYNSNASANTGIAGSVTNVVYTTNNLVVQPSTGNLVTAGYVQSHDMYLVGANGNKIRLFVDADGLNIFDSEGDFDHLLYTDGDVYLGDTEIDGSLNVFAHTIIGGTLTTGNNIVIPNRFDYAQKDTGGTVRSLLSVSSGNILNVGYGMFAGGYMTLVHGKQITFRTGTSTASFNTVIDEGGNMVFPNGRGLYICDTANTGRNMMLLNSNNVALLCYGTGVAGYTTQIHGGRIDFYIGASTTVLQLGQYSLHAYVGFYSDGYVSALGANTSSDIRKKDVLGARVLSIDEIANAPSIKYQWKQNKALGTQVGSIAQYWERVLPEAVHKDTDGYMTMQYGVIALLAGIATAKKVREHERRISELEKECERLRTENEQMKLNLNAA